MTRAFQARASLAPPYETVTLGLTATVRVTDRRPGPIEITVPLAAVFNDHGTSSVWVVDTAAGALRASPVTLSGVDGNRYVIRAGVQPGDLIVTAGVHRLTARDRVALYPGGERPTELAAQR